MTGRPPVVDLARWQQERDEVLLREKAHTREDHAIAAARRRLPMVEPDGTTEIVAPRPLDRRGVQQVSGHPGRTVVVLRPSATSRSGG